MTPFKHLLEDETAATMTEYALLMALIAVAALGALTTLRGAVIATFDAASAALVDGVVESSS